MCPSLYPQPTHSSNAKSKGKGKPWSKGTGKGAYEVELEDTIWNWEHENVHQDDNRDQDDDIGEVQPWSVVVSRARSTKDMRPQKNMNDKTKKTTNNRFAPLQDNDHVHENDELIAGAINTKGCSFIQVNRSVNAVNKPTRWAKKLQARAAGGG